MKQFISLMKQKWSYLLVLTIFFIITILLNNPFNIEAIFEYKHDAIIQGGRTPQIEQGVVISQKFTSIKNNLSRIGIFSLMPSISTNSNVNVIIKEVATGTEILNQDVFLGSLKDGSYFEINIETQPNSKDVEYEVIITGIDGDQYNSIQFPYSCDNYGYLSGAYVNGESTGTNVLIKTTYASSYIKFYMLMWVLLYIASAFFIIYDRENEINEKVFLKFALILGIFVILYSPICNPYDEISHYFRSLLISQGDFHDLISDNNEIGGWIPSNATRFMAVFEGRNGASLKNIFTDNESILEKYDNNYTFVGHKYLHDRIPIGHMIPAFGIFIARLLHLSIFASIILARLMVYVFYVFCCYFAIKNVKYYKNAFFIAATTPIAFWLAGTISLDPILNGSILLFVSICLKYYFGDEEDTYISKLDLLLLTITAVLAIACKSFAGIPALLLFFIIPKKKFKSTKKYIAFLVFAIIIGSFLIGWQFWINHHFDIEGSGEDRNGNVNPEEQMIYIKENPTAFIRMMVKVLLNNGSLWMENFSSNSTTSALAKSSGFILILCTILETNKCEKLVKNKWLNLLLISIFLVMFIGSEIAMYFAYTPVGKNNIDGFQIRYFCMCSIFAFIPLSNMFKIKNEIKNYDKKLALIMLLCNLDLILSQLMLSFKK